MYIHNNNSGAHQTRSRFKIDKSPMRLLLILITILSMSSCVNHQPNRGQYFIMDNRSSFYLSIAPSFDAPYEYEISLNNLVLRKFDGLGGYEWGKSKDVSSTTLTREQQQMVRLLAITAIKNTILEEEKGIDVVVKDGTSWHIQSDYGLGPSLSASTNNPPQSFFELRDFIEGLLEGKQDEILRE